MRALIIRQPWIDLILNGKKIWEMRPKPTTIRGQIALLRAKSGLIVGTARLVDSKPALNRENYMKYQSQHAISDTEVEGVIAAGWVYPWVLEDVQSLEVPVPSNHRPGPVVFVILDPSVSQAVSNTARRTSKPPKREEVRSPSPSPEPRRSELRRKTPPTITGEEVEEAPEETSSPVFSFRPENAQAFGRLLSANEFLVLKDSTAMRDGSPSIKRDAEQRDHLLREKVLVPDTDPRLYRFVRDYVFSSASKAAGIIKDGNASGPSLWKDEKTGQTLKDYLNNANIR